MTMGHFLASLKRSSKNTSSDPDLSVSELMSQSYGDRYPENRISVGNLGITRLAVGIEWANNLER
jgi:hypothetical protein